MRASLVRSALLKYTLTAPSPLIRTHGPALQAALPPSLADDFAIYPDFYTLADARRLLELALWKLDRLDPSRRRKRRGKSDPSGASAAGGSSEHGGALAPPLQDVFSGSYGFEEGHFDSVIHDYRESLITSLPPTADDALAGVLARLYALLPSIPLADTPTPADLPPPQSSTHALHLAPHGAILPHVDNLDAMGETIVGASLGAARVLRLEKDNGEDAGSGWDVLLPSGSVYIQKGTVRYGYKHSILGYDDAGSEWDGQKLPPGHRVSFMVRDAPSKPPSL